jgi:hypothetical protein
MMDHSFGMYIEKNIRERAMDPSEKFEFNFVADDEKKFRG